VLSFRRRLTRQARYGRQGGAAILGHYTGLHTLIAAGNGATRRRRHEREGGCPK
jgi:hypothetical protein